MAPVDPAVNRVRAIPPPRQLPDDAGAGGCYSPPMKFVNAFVVIVLISFVMGLGLLLAAHGHGAWLAILSVLGFLGLFVQYGCRAH